MKTTKERSEGPKFRSRFWSVERDKGLSSAGVQLSARPLTQICSGWAAGIRDMDAAGELYDRHAGRVLALARRTCVMRAMPRTSCRRCFRKPGVRPPVMKRAADRSRAGC